MCVESSTDNLSHPFEEIHQTDIFFLIVSESRACEAPHDTPIQSRRCQHPRRGTGTLEAEVCVLDPSPSSRRERGCEGKVDRDGGSESSGRLGDSTNAGLDGLDDKLSSSIYVDTNGMTESEIYWKDYLFNYPYYERQYEWYKEPLGYEEDISATNSTANNADER